LLITFTNVAYKLLLVVNSSALYEYQVFCVLFMLQILALERKAYVFVIMAANLGYFKYCEIPKIANCNIIKLVFRKS